MLYTPRVEPLKILSWPMKVSELNMSYIGCFLLYASIIESQTSELSEGTQTKHVITFVCLYCRESIKPLFWLKVI